MQDYRNSMEQQLERLRSDFALIKSESVAIRNGIDKLQKIVIDGNGTGPLVSRIAVIENKLSEIKDSLSKTESHSIGIRLSLLMAFISFVSNIILIVFGLIIRK